MNPTASLMRKRCLMLLACLGPILSVHGCDSERSDRPEWIRHLKGGKVEAHIAEIEAGTLQGLERWASLSPDAEIRQNAKACIEMAKMPGKGIWPRTPVIVFAGLIDMGPESRDRYELFIVVFDVWGGAESFEFEATEHSDGRHASIARQEELSYPVASPDFVHYYGWPVRVMSDVNVSERAAIEKEPGDGAWPDSSIPDPESVKVAVSCRNIAGVRGPAEEVVRMSRADIEAITKADSP